jgi:hypothetical protein
MKPSIIVTPFDLAMLAATIDGGLASELPEKAIKYAMALLKAAEKAWEELE